MARAMAHRLGWVLPMHQSQIIHVQVHLPEGWWIQGHGHSHPSRMGRHLEIQTQWLPPVGSRQGDRLHQPSLGRAATGFKPTELQPGHCPGGPPNPHQQGEPLAWPNRQAMQRSQQYGLTLA